MKKPVKPMKGTIPAGFANGGKAKPFAGKDDKAEEMAEARAVRSGKVSPKGYVAGERKEGEKVDRKALMGTGKALASGKVSPAQYASKAKMANGGRAMKKGC